MTPPNRLSILAGSVERWNGTTLWNGTLNAVLGKWRGLFPTVIPESNPVQCSCSKTERGRRGHDPALRIDEKGGSFEPPNILILAQITVSVNRINGILTGICVLHKRKLVNLYNIAACKTENPVILYSHKRKAPFQKKDFLPPFFLKRK